ncbi:MAG: hypothetical protein IJS67_00210 [Clostridia bacterium]|nr:hypothetical protein [Clostridia bacterium]
MKGKNRLAVVSGLLALTVAVGATAVSCGEEGTHKDAVVLMTEALSGLYNPFYATTGADMGVVGLTQISMLSTNDAGDLVAGDDYDTVVQAFDGGVYNSAKDETDYTFVLKNGIKFSDGVPLTINDVMFNIYEYLDPVYTGSSTMYSIKIKGLTQYRTQTNVSGGGTGTQDSISDNATKLANERIKTLRTLFTTKGLVSGTTSSYKLTETQMKAAIDAWNPTTGYKNAVATTKQQTTMTTGDYRALLKEDYELALTTFKDELETDFKAAQDSFDTDTMPYSEWKDKLGNEVFRFFLFEGYIRPKYEKDGNGKDNKLKIESFENENYLDDNNTKEKAINKVYQDNVVTAFHQVLSYWGTANKLQTRYIADATDVLLHNNMKSGSLLFPNIEGVVSLGHTTSVDKVTVGNNEYKVAHEYNSDGTPKNANEYAVLRITIEGKDPKAIYNFSFSVAPAHYYSDGGTYGDVYGSEAKGKATTKIDIANNMFGVDYGSSTFQSKVIQSLQHVEVPLGAGAFMATDIDDSDTPAGSGFVSSNIVYYKANRNFMFEVKAPKLQMQVISSTNALDKLASGEVDYVTPQFTKTNSERLKNLASEGIKKLDAWQLGYGYIGINAGKVPNVYIRRAIMTAMETSLAIEYYEKGSCRTIDWPMSMESWAYPFSDANRTQSKQNGHDYTQFTTAENAKKAIKDLMAEAKKSPKQGDTYKIKFTIAGSSITEHPTYAVFKQAMEILNDCGWDVEVKADSQALNKLSTGSLEVWAAAWGSTIDPDMYQVYHKNSTATSTFAWGYREIKANPTGYAYETGVINELSTLIDQGRQTLDREERKEIYEQAMGKVLDLAIEMPVYQRKTLYAYNTNTIKGLREDVSPYSSPLEKIWNIELV